MSNLDFLDLTRRMNARARSVWDKQGGRAAQDDIDNYGNMKYFEKKYGTFGTTDIYDRIRDARDSQAASKTKQVADQQKALYGDFKRNLSQNKNQAFGLIAGQERNRLNQEMKQNAQSFNQRGLLYSGLKQGTDARSQVQSATNLTQARQGINQQFDTQLEDIRAKRIQTGFDMQANQQMIADMAYQRALESMAAKKSALGNVLGIGGGVAGGVLSGGNPMGVMAGASSGQMLGQMAG